VALSQWFGTPLEETDLLAKWVSLSTPVHFFLFCLFSSCSPSDYSFPLPFFFSRLSCMLNSLSGSVSRGGSILTTAEVQFPLLLRGSLKCGGSFFSSVESGVLSRSLADRLNMDKKSLSFPSLLYRWDPLNRIFLLPSLSITDHFLKSLLLLSPFI